MGLNVDEDVVDARVGAAVKTLWADAGIQSAYEIRAKFQLNDSAAL
jgi:guanine nucleotide-binding protein G(i) subunit alpha